MTNQPETMNLHSRLSADEAIAIAAAMNVISQADGVHPAEEEMIADFISGVAEDLGETVELPAMTPDDLAQKIHDPDIRRLAVQSLILIAMADGAISEKEGKLNQEYATALGLGAEYEAMESSITNWVKEGDFTPLFA